MSELPPGDWCSRCEEPVGPPNWNCRCGPTPRACGCDDPPGVVCEHERDEYVIEDGSRTMRPVTAKDYDHA